MQYVTLGKTGLKVSRTAFGALPIQRCSFDEAAEILRYAYDNGVNFFDTARIYSNSEEKIAYALSDVRKNIIIATKSQATSLEVLKRDINQSLTNLKTDYVDLFQFHNPKVLIPEDMTKYVQELKNQGVVRHIGITNHSKEIAANAVLSGLYETLQYPFSSLSSQEEINLVRLCEENNVGYIAMKAMAGGLIQSVEANFAFIRSYPWVVPIWGIQKLYEIKQFIELENNPPELNSQRKSEIEQDKERLSGRFCRSCGYCKPCPIDLPLEQICRLDMLLERAVFQNFLTTEWQGIMNHTKDCIGCGACDSRCPYQLNPQQLIKSQYENYLKFVEEHK